MFSGTKIDCKTGIDYESIYPCLICHTIVCNHNWYPTIIVITCSRKHLLFQEMIGSIDSLSEEQLQELLSILNARQSIKDKLWTVYQELKSYRVL